MQTGNNGSSWVRKRKSISVRPRILVTLLLSKVSPAKCISVFTKEIHGMIISATTMF